MTYEGYIGSSSMEKDLLKGSFGHINCNRDAEFSPKIAKKREIFANFM
jgi:hypothetical protein